MTRSRRGLCIVPHPLASQEWFAFRPSKPPTPGDEDGLTKRISHFKGTKANLNLFSLNTKTKENLGFRKIRQMRLFSLELSNN